MDGRRRGQVLPATVVVVVAAAARQQPRRLTGILAILREGGVSVRRRHELGPERVRVLDDVVPMFIGDNHLLAEVPQDGLLFCSEKKQKGGEQVSKEFCELSDKVNSRTKSPTQTLTASEKRLEMTQRSSSPFGDLRCGDRGLLKLKPLPLQSVQ